MKKLLLLLPFTLLFFTSPSEAATTTHTVVSGDTMWKIAVKYQVGCQEIIDANSQVSNPNLIYPGQKLNIPTKSSEEVSTEQEILKLVNAERSKQGLSPLTLDWELSRVAKFKSEDMRDNNYFSHTSPTYGSPFQMMKSFGISYKSAGENIAAEQIGISQASMVASNVMGGDMAKMISPQSVAVAAAAVGLAGRENELFKFTIKISVIFLTIVGILNLIINL